VVIITYNTGTIYRSNNMAMYRELKPGKIYMGKLKHDSDLLQELTSVCEENNIRLGRVEALGAVQKARLAYYNQQSREYQFFELNQHLEITSLQGNVSIKEDRPIIHAHVTLADKEGRAYGGHLAPGTVVFACEFCLQVLEGPEYQRAFDQETGLPLWDMSVK
jgi:predicted DNA-binding protein with PD1-like motif